MNRNLDVILEQFEGYCTNDKITGKAKSYKNAISYLCEYLNIIKIDRDSLYNIDFFVKSLYNEESNTYKEFLKFLINRGQSSYLKKGFIRAAAKQFFSFFEFNI